ncbi:MAG: MoaD/ThiS family protein [Euryarchaeota archaeon]|nr:MoaD/ThiS family protein [Euryarchaeota archaeon]
MEIEVRFYGGFAVAAGTESARVVFGGASLGALLEEVRRRWKRVAELLDGPGKGSAVLVLNGGALEGPDPDTPLAEGDVLSIMPFVAGG